MPEVIDSGVAYLALKAAQKLYSKALAALQPEEFERVQSMAQQQHKLEARVLVAPEARDVMVPAFDAGSRDAGDSRPLSE